MTCRPDCRPATRWRWRSVRRPRAASGHAGNSTSANGADLRKGIDRPELRHPGDTDAARAKEDRRRRVGSDGGVKDLRIDFLRDHLRNELAAASQVFNDAAFLELDVRRRQNAVGRAHARKRKCVRCSSRGDHLLLHEALARKLIGAITHPRFGQPYTALATRHRAQFYQNNDLALAELRSQLSRDELLSSAIPVKHRGKDPNA